MGYAVSIVLAGSGAWSTNTSKTVQSTSYPQTNYASACSDMNGYDETIRITGNSSYNATTYPAFFLARNFGSSVPIPSQTSGWFLPSIGQCMTAKINLYGGYTNTSYLKNGCETSERVGWYEKANGVPSGFCATYQSRRSSYWANFYSVFSDITPYNEIFTWSSTESTKDIAIASQGYDSDGPYIIVQRYMSKTSNQQVMPILAF